MFDHIHPSTSATPARAAFDCTCAFLEQHGSALANAAKLLGGAPAEARVHSLIEHVREAQSLTRHARDELIALHRLLSLRDVGDPDRIETALFARIDPSSPVVEDICRLTEALRDLLEKIAASGTDASTAVPFGRPGTREPA